MAESCLILYYHRVGRPSPDPQLLAVSPENFESHLRTIVQMANPVSLETLANGPGGRTSDRTPDRPNVAVTFDDGYLDNLELALPLLEKHAVPAVFYACTGYMDQGRELWWDELERLLLGPGLLPETLCLDLPGGLSDGLSDGPVRFDLGDAAELSPGAALAHSGWDVTQAHAPSPRHEAYRLLHKGLRPLGFEHRERVLGTLAAMASQDRRPRQDRRVLDEQALRTLDRSPFGRVGCHTVSHPMLTRLSAGEAQEEIAWSKSRLEGILDREVTDFSYPYGSAQDFDRGTRDILATLGFRTACTTVRGVARPGQDLLALPRIGVRNLGGVEFRRFLEAELTESER